MNIFYFNKNCLEDFIIKNDGYQFILDRNSIGALKNIICNENIIIPPCILLEDLNRNKSILSKHYKKKKSYYILSYKGDLSLKFNNYNQFNKDIIENYFGNVRQTLISYGNGWTIFDIYNKMFCNGVTCLDHKETIISNFEKIFSNSNWHHKNFKKRNKCINNLFDALLLAEAISVPLLGYQRNNNEYYTSNGQFLVTENSHDFTTKEVKDICKNTLNFNIIILCNTPNSPITNPTTTNKT